MRPAAWLCRIAATAAACVALAGCAGARAPRSALPPPAAGPAQRIAMLPLEDLSGQAGVGERLTHIVFTALGRMPAYEVVEPGQVDAALSAARIRSTSMLSKDQVVALSARLAVRWLLTGSALEFGPVHTPDGDVPSVGLALRLIDGTTGRVRWADERIRNGDDRETVFGWGRENDGNRLAERTAAELLAALRMPADGDTAVVVTTKGEVRK